MKQRIEISRRTAGLILGALLRAVTFEDDWRDDGLPQRTEVGARPPAQDEQCKCGHSRSSHDEMGLSENLIVLPQCRRCNCKKYEPNPASLLPRPEARLQELLLSLDADLVMVRRLIPEPATDPMAWADSALSTARKVSAEARALEARLRAVVEQWRAKHAEVGTFHATMGTGWKVCADELDAILRSSATRTQPEKESQ